MIDGNQNTSENDIFESGWLQKESKVLKQWRKQKKMVCINQYHFKKLQRRKKSQQSNRNYRIEKYYKNQIGRIGNKQRILFQNRNK
ncbi:hypothetical protein IMG5_177210 [Ichthyophthirius multifiliis]|uniref:Uncharacterized protein n=1 Tax=Ichthyophthirius multifiliis TaxID=5932 RepID=G0R2D8_ICHMU|nr:hypothetical protein IMG5_177210 [Ichthyophthirius multifiliis]EGR28374.1 hypothetical protein IMG5_177210 [Ichthyophthirius multifiliis]|eukprot:XP_004027719.1 hypothetical protein IMG5_177210 [Ichthyophthirius multifiliis]